MLSKETLNEIISDGNILGQKCIVRDGFVFTSITEPHNVFDAIVIRNPYEECLHSHLLSGKSP